MCHDAPEESGVVERFHRSLKYEHFYQREIDTAVELAEEVDAYLALANEIGPHTTLDSSERSPCTALRLFPVQLSKSFDSEDGAEVPVGWPDHKVGQRLARAREEGKLGGKLQLPPQL